jgi:hypothetical protein
MPTETPVPADHPMMKAWKAYEATDDFANSKKWAGKPEHVDGSLWAAFVQGWVRATEQAATPMPERKHTGSKPAKP